MMYDSFSLLRRASAVGTLLTTFLFGKLVGRDLYGNRYFVARRHKEKRWVLYAGEPEPTKIPPEWFGWVHKTCDHPLPKEGARRYQGVKPHHPNLTGTHAASLFKTPWDKQSESAQQKNKRKRLWDATQ